MNNLKNKLKLGEQQIVELKGKNDKLTSDLDISKQSTSKLALEVSNFCPQKLDES